MGDKTGIEWTDAGHGVLRGARRRAVRVRAVRVGRGRGERAVNTVWRAFRHADAPTFFSPVDKLPRPRVSIPLDRLALCLDCNQAFEVGGPCPACGTATFVLIASFFKSRDA